MPSFAGQMMPAPLLNAMIHLCGVRLRWMKGHACPCVQSGDAPGSPDPACNTCHGRGRWWEPPLAPFIGLRTFMHTSEAADEPGAAMNPRLGQELLAEPTITIGSNSLPMWTEAAEFDAFVEIDTHTRFETTLLKGTNMILPYQQGLEVLGVTVYNPALKKAIIIPDDGWTNTNGEINVLGAPDGTSYTVMYKAMPVYVAWRRAGANPHTRPFGGGSAPLPVRFRGMLLDVWTRARNQAGMSASPEAVL